MRLYLIISSLLIFTNSFAQPQWLWSFRDGGIKSEIAKSSCMDAQGNIYMAGGFNCCTTTFGSQVLTGAGDFDIFIVKYDPAGNVIWARSAGGSDAEMANGISVDRDGNIYTTGYFLSDSIAFGNTILTCKDSSAAVSDGDGFIAKYDSSGNLIWVKSFGGEWADHPYSITLDKSDNFYITGYFNSHELVLDTITLTNQATTSCFLAKYDKNGNIIWAKKEGSGGNTVSNAVITDAFNNVYITGEFDGWSLIISSTFWITNYGISGSDYFVARYDSSGNILWARGRTGTQGNVFGNDLCIDAGNNLLVTGTFYGTHIEFDSIPIDNINGNNYMGDIFIVKYDQNGNGSWASRAGGPNDDSGAEIQTDAFGDVYVTGKADELYMFCNNDSFPGKYYGGYVAKFSSNGTANWAIPMYGAGSGISIDADNRPIVSGIFNYQPCVFGNDTLINSGPSNTNDIFIAGLDTMTIYTSVNYLQTANANQLSISPNPFNNFTEIKFSISVQNGSLKIYDAFGKCLSVFNNISGDKFIIDRNKMNAGVYYIEFTDNSGERVLGKIVVVD